MAVQKQDATTTHNKNKKGTQHAPVRTPSSIKSVTNKKCSSSTCISIFKKFIYNNGGPLTILFALTQICLIIIQIISAHIQQNINELYQPLEFSVTRGAVSGVYGNTGLDAYSTDMKIISGSLSQMYVLSYNEIDNCFMITGEYFEPEHIHDYLPSVSTNPIYKEESLYISKIYDYFFIYAIAANGTRYVNCYYYTVDLQSEQVDGPFQVHEIELINATDFTPLISYSYGQMLYRYQMLMNSIAAIPYSSCGQIANDL